MKKTLSIVACVLAIFTTFSLMQSSKNPGVFGVDIVSAATETTGTTTTGTSGSSTSSSTSTTTRSTFTKLSSLVRYGSRGTNVKKVQTLVNSIGYTLRVDGISGQKLLAQLNLIKRRLD